MLDKLKKMERTRLILLGIIAASIPCYCLGLALLKISDITARESSATPTETLSLTVTGLTATFTLPAASQSPTLTPTRTATFTPTTTYALPPTLTPTLTLTPSLTPTASPQPTASETPVPTATDTDVPIESPSPSPDLTVTSTQPT